MRTPLFLGGCMKVEIAKLVINGNGKIRDEKGKTFKEILSNNIKGVGDFEIIFIEGDTESSLYSIIAEIPDVGIIDKKEGVENGEQP